MAFQLFLRSFIGLFCCIILLNALPAGAATITITDANFYDVERDRTIEYKLYSPDPIPIPAPVILFSHGLGGSDDSASYLGEALAKAGYMAFFIQHPGSDKSLWEGLENDTAIRQALRQSIRNPEMAINRYRDIQFFLDQLEEINAPRGPLEGMLDLDRIGMAGHSFGAHNVLVAAGEKNTEFRDGRVKAGLVLSPSPPESHIGIEDENVAPVYSAVNIPILHVTGTKDEHPFRPGFDPAIRTKPYSMIRAPGQYLLVIEGADHATFGAGTIDEARVSDKPHQKLVTQAAILFFNSYLRSDQQALSDLNVGFQKQIGLNDSFEHK